MCDFFCTVHSKKKGGLLFLRSVAVYGAQRDIPSREEHVYIRCLSALCFLKRCEIHKKENVGGGGGGRPGLFFRIGPYKNNGESFSPFWERLK